MMMGCVWAQQKKPSSKPVKSKKEQYEVPQGNKSDSALMRRDVDNMREDSMRMKYDTARSMQNSMQNFPGKPGNNSSGVIQDSINKNAMGSRPVLTDTSRRGERERMKQPPTPNSTRRDSVRHK